MKGKAPADRAGKPDLGLEFCPKWDGNHDVEEGGAMIWLRKIPPASGWRRDSKRHRGQETSVEAAAGVQAIGQTRVGCGENGV